MIECNHEKVYNAGIALLIPPHREWICRKCGITGIELMNDSDGKEFHKVKEKFFIKRIRGL